MTEVVINPNDGFVSITAAGGETNLDFDFPIYAKSHLRVLRTRSGTQTTLTLDTDYTIATNQLELTAGGVAVLTSSATAGDIYTLLLDVPEGRTTDFVTAGDFLAATLNRELDLQTQMLQGIRRDLDKSARLPDNSTISMLTLPTPVANNLLGWNSGATGLENKVITDASTTTISAFIGTLLDDSTASEALTTLGVSTYAKTILDDTSAAAARVTLDAERTASALTQVAPTSSDFVVISDASDSNLSKKALFPVLYGYICGFIASSIAGTSTTASLSISAGQATNSTNIQCLSGGAFSWAVSNGAAANGYEGGTTLPNSSTIHFYVMALSTDATWTASFASTSLTPALPGSYTLYRRAFSIPTNSSGALIPGSAVEVCGGGLVYYLTTEVLDVNVSNLSTSRTLYTLTVPSGIKVEPFFRFAGTTNPSAVLITSPEQSDVAPGSSSSVPLQDAWNDVGQLYARAKNGYVVTDTSGRIGARSSNASTTFHLVTFGWCDFRRL